MNFNTFKRGVVLGVAVLSICAVCVPAVMAQPLPGGSLDPTTIPQFVTPLVIPPVMNNNGTVDNYDIAVRQFQQQILPAGMPATTVWSYGPAADPTPTVAPDPASQFNYPAYTIETMTNVPVNVRWINELVQNPDACFDAVGVSSRTSPQCDSIPHILPVDQTLHWANPPAIGCRDGSSTTDCATNDPMRYTGPVPIVTHVHGAHVASDSDGYPEAWWLPAASDIPPGYMTEGTLFDDALGQARGLNLGYADYSYIQTQPATTLWYHDHSLGMTRLNVYAGPAGFWLIRGGQNDKGTDSSTGKMAVFPRPAPAAGQTVLQLNVPGNTVRNKIREIPIVVQDRSFNTDGSLFYPDNRAFFERTEDGDPLNPCAFSADPGSCTEPYLHIPFVGEFDDMMDPLSDIAPIWNPEAFFNVMVVNGVSWPTLDVAQAMYRFRLLNGCNSRFLNLSLKITASSNGALVGTEIPFYQIGAEQGFLRQVVRIQTNEATPLPGDGTNPMPAAVPILNQALLMGLAERADVIVDFSALPNGTMVTMINTGPDEPFGGDFSAPADPDTTGKVMQFVVNSALNGFGQSDPVKRNGRPNPRAATSPYNLVLNAEPALAGPIAVTRQVSLNEGESELVCVTVDMAENVVQAFDSITGDPLLPPDCEDSDPTVDAMAMPFGPKEALLGVVNLTGGPGGNPIGIPLKWTDTTGTSSAVNVTLQNGSVIPVNVTENPTVGSTEIWEMYNFTADAHPIHLHLVRFEVLSRAAIPGFVPVADVLQAWESGFKDTVITYPGEITRVKANFDIAGLYVWHCHIVEHEDNEMMRPYVVQ